MKHLVVDISNIFWRAVAASKGSVQAAGDGAGIGLHMSMMSLKKYWNKIQPDRLVVAFEGKDNWRKTYTKSAVCYSERLYKGNRVANPEMAVLFDVIAAFRMLVEEHSRIVTLSHPLLEGDDLISGYAQHFSATDEVVILSGDKDFVQLLGNPNIKLMNPDDGKERTLEGVCGVDDAGYFLFEKCMRGDAGDNVLPAFPRVRTAKLHKAFGVRDGKVYPAEADAMMLSNLFESEWDFARDTGEKRVMSVKRMFAENELLMGLASQPENIRQIINETVTTAEPKNPFNFFAFNKFLGKYELKSIAEHASDFVPMFSGVKPVAKKTVSPGGFSF